MRITHLQKESDMEFNEKLQNLRKQKGLTQEQLAEALFVSRTAVSKWESGRGYPSIDSLKEISKFFGVTIDVLLSGGEALTIAQKDHEEKQSRFTDRVFALLDLSALLLLFLPFFGQKTDGLVLSVPLLALGGLSPLLKAAYLLAVIILPVCGVAALALKDCRQACWLRARYPLSLLISSAGILLFIVSPQPYAAAFLFVLLLVKAGIYTKKR